MIEAHSAGLPLLRTPALRLIEQAAAGMPLMERAGAAAADLAERIRSDRSLPVLIVAGPGNNGGDAFVVGRHLAERSCPFRMVFAGDADRLPDDARLAYDRFRATGKETIAAIPSGSRWSLVIDGLFGIGLTRPVEGDVARLIDDMNDAAAASRCPLLALDCPSGLDADTGTIRGVAVRATHTLSFIASKPGLLTADGPDHCGKIHVASLGLDAERMLTELPLDVAERSASCGSIVGRELFAEHLQRRKRNSHKGSHGSAGIIGGAPGMTGAAVLAGRAAIRLGAGRVYVGLTAPGPAMLDPGQPDLMLRDAASVFAAPLTALACGPGLGTGGDAPGLLAAAISSSLPLVLDADALNLLAADGEFRVGLASRNAQTVLTPHPSEAARLLDDETATVQADRIGAAREIAAQFGALVVLKGCGTIIAAANGHWWINPSGSPALASAGTGDVLTGMIVALLAQGWPLAAASQAAVLLHGLAAESAAAAIGGEIGVTASELADPARRLFNGWIAETSMA